MTFSSFFFLVFSDVWGREASRPHDVLQGGRSEPTGLLGGHQHTPAPLRQQHTPDPSGHQKCIRRGQQQLRHWVCIFSNYVLHKHADPVVSGFFWLH